MKVVILCGGKGTRLREETEYRPKPMVPIGNRPILWHIMKIYAAHGHKDFRVPTKGELNVLYENRNKGKLKGTFNETGSAPAGWYWSSSQTYLTAWAQRFSDGHQSNDARIYYSSLRCVR